MNELIKSQVDNLLETIKTQLDTLYSTEDLVLVAVNINNLNDIVKAQIANLQRQREEIDHQVKGLKEIFETIGDQFAAEMLKHQIQKIKIPGNLTVLRRKSTIVEVEDANELPDEYTRIKVEADKRKIMAFWKETGLLPPGAKINISQHVKIKGSDEVNESEE